MSAQKTSDFFAAGASEVVPGSSCSTRMGNRDIIVQETDVGMQSATLKSFETETLVMGNVTPSKRFRRICVFCGSSSGKKDVFSNEALSLGRELVSIIYCKHEMQLFPFCMYAVMGPGELRGPVTFFGTYPGFGVAIKKIESARLLF